MGDIIDFSQHIDAPSEPDELVRLISGCLKAFDDESSGQWIADTIEKMCNDPVFKFQFSAQAATPADEAEIRRLSNEFAEFLHQILKEVQFAMVKVFVESYIDKKKVESGILV